MIEEIDRKHIHEELEDAADSNDSRRKCDVMIGKRVWTSHNGLLGVDATEICGA
jgi:hypothetical protein